MSAWNRDPAGILRLFERLLGVRGARNARMVVAGTWPRSGRVVRCRALR